MVNHLSQDLCKQCSLCCDGTLFRLTPIDPPSEHLFTYANQRPNGCEQLSVCGSCKIYENRPRGCRLFKCGVLKDLEEGSLKYEEAQKIIDDVKKDINDQKFPLYINRLSQR